MQSTPGDRQPLEDEGLKAGQHGRGCQPHHTQHVLAHQTHTLGLAWKKVLGCLGVYTCAHKCTWLCVASSVCVLSEGWDSVLMMKGSRAIE